jgi:hypothetical protein
MVERRPLVDGLASTPAIDPQKEKEFVYGQKGAETPPVTVAPVAAPIVAPTVAAAPIAPAPPAAIVQTFPDRVQVSTRLRGDFAAALKRASLERELNGVTPFTVQDILEQALEPWLKANGYIR